jgi:hypothetical protein
MITDKEVVPLINLMLRQSVVKLTVMQWIRNTAHEAWESLQKNDTQHTVVYSNKVCDSSFFYL